MIYSVRAKLIDERAKKSFATSLTEPLPNSSQMERRLSHQWNEPVLLTMAMPVGRKRVTAQHLLNMREKLNWTSIFRRST